MIPVSPRGQDAEIVGTVDLGVSPSAQLGERLDEPVERPAIGATAATKAVDGAPRDPSGFGDGSLREGAQGESD